MNVRSYCANYYRILDTKLTHYLHRYPLTTNIGILLKDVLIDLRARNFMHAKTSSRVRCVHARHRARNLSSPDFISIISQDVLPRKIKTRRKMALVILKKMSFLSFIFYIFYWNDFLFYQVYQTFTLGRRRYLSRILIETITFQKNPTNLYVLQFFIYLY